jgi:hypothetical protein
VVETALVAARTIRLRLACCAATCATTPNFRAVETLLTASILTASGATMAQACAAIEPFRGGGHPSGSVMFCADGDRGTAWISNSNNS